MGAGVPSGRVVAVRARLSDEEVSVGSGVLVSDRLVLTAAHVIAEPGGRVLGPLEVRLSGSARWWPATVSWADLSDAMDVAVLRVGAEGDGWEPPALPPVRFSRLTGLAGQVDCEAQGFPRSLKDGEERVRDHATGPVNPGVDEQGRRYDVLIREFPAEPPPRSGQSSPWSGMSGAGLFADGLLLGILTLRTGGFGERRLRATPLRVLAADAAFRDALTGGRPLALESVELHRLFTETIDDWGDSPALLLHPLRAVVGFYGRHDERRALTDWCTASTEPATRVPGTKVPGTTAKVQALTGPGGQGKTRLAEQVCADLAAAGWVAGFLAADATTDQITILADTNTPVLIVVDYADTRHDQTHALLRILRQRTAAPVRALLLARSASRDSGWWAQLRSQFPDLCATVEPRPLPPLQPDGTRADAFHHAAIDLATVWARTDSTADWPTIARRLPAPRDLDANRYALALTLQMAALTALLQAGPRPVEASAGDDVADVLLGHEQRYWTASATARGLAPRFPDVLLRWAVVTAALCGAADRAEAVDTVGRLADLREEPPASRLTLAEWLHHLYPAADDRYWGALQPDRIAEHLVSHTLTAGSDPYPQLATDVLATARPRQLTQALIVLARAAAHQNGVPALLAGLLTQPPISSAVTQLPLHDLTAILDAFPNFSLRLTDTAATLTGLTIDQLRRNTDQPPDLARQLNNQSVRLADLGRREDALTTITEAVTLYHRLATTHPDTFTPDLAKSLNNQSNRLADLGRHENALTTITEAVTLYRQLATTHPDTFTPDLASSLNNQSNRLADLGQRENALTTITEAVTLYQDLYRRYPQAFAAGLIRSLANSGERLRGAGQTDRLIRGLAQARGVASSHQIDDFDAWIVLLLRDERLEQPDVFDAAWREITGTPVPDGLDPGPADG